MQSRTFLRIEGDLVSLVSEVIDREVTLPDLLTELTSSQVAITPRLPTGCRYWLRSGTTDRQVFVLEQAPSRRTIEYHASRRHDSEPVTYRIALPYVVFVVSTIGEQIEGLSTYFRTEPVGSLDATLLCSTLPNTSDDGLVCLGSVRVAGSIGRRAGRRPDRRLLGQPLQPGPATPSAALQRWLPGLGQPLPAGSVGRPLAPVRPVLADPPPGGRPHGGGGAQRPAGSRRPKPKTQARPRSGPRSRRRSKEASSMNSLPEHVRRTQPVRTRSLALMVAPFIGARVGTLPIRHVEDAAITVLAAVFGQSGPLREQLVTERSRFERLVHAVHRAPARRGEEQ